MSKLVWDETGKRFYETGVKRGVLYPQNSSGIYPTGVAWNGLTGVTEKPSGAEATALYANDAKYLNLMSAEEFAATIEAYTYPDEFAQCDGSASIADGVSIGQQERKAFGLCYRTVFGNDVDGDDFSYKLHIIYGAKAAPSEKAYATINDSPEAITLSWELSTTPVNVNGYKPTACITIDTNKITDKTKVTALENILYGIDAPAFNAASTYAIGDYVTYTEKVYKCKTAITVPAAWAEGSWTEVTNSGPRLPLPDEIASIMAVG